MPARYIRADEPAGAEYYVRVLRPGKDVESWTVVRDDSRNGGTTTLYAITREQWHREVLDGVFVPILPDRG